MRVDEIDDKGKVSLTPVGDEPEQGGAAGGDGSVATDGNGSAVVSVSFEDTFDAELSQEVGDLGPNQREAPGDGGRSRDAGSCGRGRRRHERFMRPAKALERPPCRSLFMTERISQRNGLGRHRFRPCGEVGGDGGLGLRRLARRAG